ncbi:MAG TPA: pantetheine-phosphate adenylyltransferase [Chloroflexota bacterium]|jgi:pantetheine-phosphate adenylyltransferase|nr:pantetheine-phosphate adenylyltransferase [Chloroflexota bacterium]
MIDQTRREGLIAVYPGSFDPVHLGHIDIAHRAAAVFDRVIVAVFDRPSKSLRFTTDQRVRLFQDGLQCDNIQVIPYTGLTIDLARKLGAGAIVRGLRATSDFEYEYQMTTMNRHLEPSIEAVFLMTSLEYAYLSSSIIKEVAAQGAPLEGLVPHHVATALREEVHDQ